MAQVIDSAAAGHAALLDGRYGDGAADAALHLDQAGTIRRLLEHRSVRAFDSAPLDEAIVDTLVAAAQSASTSSNLQSWSVVVVRDQAHKSAAATLAGDQQFIRDAPVFLIFVADWARGAAIARGRDEASEGIGFLDSTLVATIDAAIAAQNAIVAAEALGLGAVFVGAVRNHPGELSALLDLPDAAFPVVGVALGWPRADDRSQVKPRLPQVVVRHDERYRAGVPQDLEGYDRTLRRFNESQGRAGGWLDAVVARVRSASALHGRERLRAILSSRGLSSS
ncbi:nitroreductase family protein [Microbacterium allomyrinae]|uniref:Nitroreductase family protein n=1 Tax=Microbacterium allomyrinae TaxID=2830666 RepID=A0A9X1LY01_9MICO|nr:nitroreductase family protein [Microbacterium allomyrinae]MCC2033932.1 nitroreductase family protein [Microbacterium allomyrinae]